MQPQVVAPEPTADLHVVIKVLVLDLTPVTRKVGDVWLACCCHINGLDGRGHNVYGCITP